MLSSRWRMINSHRGARQTIAIPWRVTMFGKGLSAESLEKVHSFWPMKAGGDLPASLPVNSSARPTISMFGGVVWAAEGPLNALHTTRPQALSPLRPWWPSTVDYKCDKTDSSDFTAVCVCTRQLWIWLQRLTGAVRVGLTPLRPSSLAHTNLTVHFDLLARPVAHTRHLTHTLLWWRTLLCVAHHLPLWTPAS